MERPHNHSPEHTQQSGDIKWPRIDGDQSVLDENHNCQLCGAHFSDPCEPECPRSKETEDNPENEPEPRYQPRIYVICLASHDRGIRHGMWIDANQEAEDLEADIAAMLDSSPVASNLPWHKAWTIEATDQFGGLHMYGHTEAHRISQLAKGVAAFGPAYAAYVEIVGTRDTDMLDRFEDFYIGSYASPEAWAKESAEDLAWPSQLDDLIPDPLLRRFVIIDYGKMAEESAESWDLVEGSDGKTHVFLR